MAIVEEEKGDTNLWYLLKVQKDLWYLLKVQKDLVLRVIYI